MSPPLLAGIEAGGTKFRCVVGTGPDDLRAETRIPTTTPAETIGRVLRFFARESRHGPPAAAGIGSFGPIDPDPRSATFGRITSTPKPGWSGVDLVSPLAAALEIPVGFDTDVNAAALAEARWGAARGIDSFVYLTVGTGIGGGAMVAGAPVHGLLHPEMGHLLVPRRDGDDFAGVCPYHGACLEGLASGPALAKRWGRRAEDLPDDHPAWELEAHYLAVGLANLVCALSPERIVLGGGVMSRRHLFAPIRSKLREILSGYVDSPAVTEAGDGFVVPPVLGGRSGVLGALVLAERASRGEPAANARKGKR